MYNSTEWHRLPLMLHRGVFVFIMQDRDQAVMAQDRPPIQIRAGAQNHQQTPLLRSEPSAPPVPATENTSRPKLPHAVIFTKVSKVAPSSVTQGPPPACLGPRRRLSTCRLQQLCRKRIDCGFQALLALARHKNAAGNRLHGNAVALRS